MLCFQFKSQKASIRTMKDIKNPLMEMQLTHSGSVVQNTSAQAAPPYGTSSKPLKIFATEPKGSTTGAKKALKRQCCHNCRKPGRHYKNFTNVTVEGTKPPPKTESEGKVRLVCMEGQSIPTALSLYNNQSCSSIPSRQKTLSQVLTILMTKMINIEITFL